MGRFRDTIEYKPSADFLKELVSSAEVKEVDKLRKHDKKRGKQPAKHNGNCKPWCGLLAESCKNCSGSSNKAFFPGTDSN